MGILKGVVYVAGALAAGAVGLYAGWELNEKYGERSMPSAGDDSGGDGGGKAPLAPTPPSSDTNEPLTDPGLHDDDLDAIRAIEVGPELAKIMREATPGVPQADVFR